LILTFNINSGPGLESSAVVASASSCEAPAIEGEHHPRFAFAIVAASASYTAPDIGA
jgi:hypothetical protein